MFKHLDRRSEVEKGSSKYYYDDDMNTKYQSLYHVFVIEGQQKVSLVYNLKLSEANELIDTLHGYNPKGNFIKEEIN